MPYSILDNHREAVERTRDSQPFLWVNLGGSSAGFGVTSKETIDRIRPRYTCVSTQTRDHGAYLRTG